jgi:hypothetical protein
MQQGDRVSMVTCPASSSPLRKKGLITSRPPGTRPGEPLVAVNHALGSSTPLVRPPSKAASSLPQWLPWIAGGLMFTEVGSGFLDPNYPVLIAAGLAAATSSVVGGNRFLLPRLKQLPENSVRGAPPSNPPHQTLSMPNKGCI